MNPDLITVLLIVGAYLLGAVPFGLVFSKFFAHVDIRRHGSRNIGATNVYRSLGKKLGALTLLADISKGFFPAWLASVLTGSELVVCATAFAAFFGHLYPIYLKFSGGKGVATAVGAYLVLAPWALLFAFVVFVLVMAGSRYVSLSSISAAIAVPAFMLVSFASYPPVLHLTAVIIAGLIVFRHQDNIKRLLSGKESKVGSKKS